MALVDVVSKEKDRGAIGKHTWSRDWVVGCRKRGTRKVRLYVFISENDCVPEQNDRLTINESIRLKPTRHTTTESARSLRVSEIVPTPTVNRVRCDRQDSFLLSFRLRTRERERSTTGTMDEIKGYRDFSGLTEAQAARLFSATTAATAQEGHAFPEKLHFVLEELAAEASASSSPPVVEWCSHGRAFRVNDPKVFLEKVLKT